MPINLEVNGNEYTNFTEAGVTLALDTLANDFSFSAALPEGEKLNIKGGDACTVIVDGELVLTGYVENITGHYTATGHNVVITGRDKTSDLIDSSIDVIDDIRDSVTLKEIIEKVITHIGSDIAVVNDATPAPFNKAEDIIAPLPGENAFLFVEQYAQKRQVILTSNANGDVVITNSQETSGGGLLQNAVKSDTNNIIEASWSYMAGNLFRKYINKGQLDPGALDFAGAKSEDGLVSQRGESEDIDIRGGRQLVTVLSKGFSDDQLLERAKWSKKIRQSRSIAYSCHVQGFTNTAGKLWAANTVVSVFDDFADINQDLLINSVQFLYGAAGSRTLLTLVPAGAYELQLKEPVGVGTNQDAFIP